MSLNEYADICYAFYALPVIHYNFMKPGLLDNNSEERCGATRDLEYLQKCNIKL